MTSILKKAGMADIIIIIKIPDFMVFYCDSI